MTTFHARMMNIPGHRLCRHAAAQIAADADAEIERLRGVLKRYAEESCEGFCSDVPVGFSSAAMEIDCSGCKARAAVDQRK